MNDKRNIEDIFAAIEAIEAYTLSSYDEFAKDTKTQHAIMFNLVIMGEAADRVSEEIKTKTQTSLGLQ